MSGLRVGIERAGKWVGDALDALSVVLMFALGALAISAVLVLTTYGIVISFAPQWVAIGASVLMLYGVAQTAFRGIKVLLVAGQRFINK